MLLFSNRSNLDPYATSRRNSVAPSRIRDLSEQVACRPHEYSCASSYQLACKSQFDLCRPGCFSPTPTKNIAALDRAPRTSELLRATQWKTLYECRTCSESTRAGDGRQRRGHLHMAKHVATSDTAAGCYASQRGNRSPNEQKFLLRFCGSACRPRGQTRQLVRQPAGGYPTKLSGCIGEAVRRRECQSIFVRDRQSGRP